jgi:hypothetical protein
VWLSGGGPNSDSAASSGPRTVGSAAKMPVDSLRRPSLRRPSLRRPSLRRPSLRGSDFYSFWTREPFLDEGAISGVLCNCFGGSARKLSPLLPAWAPPYRRPSVKAWFHGDQHQPIFNIKFRPNGRFLREGVPAAASPNSAATSRWW